MSTMEKVIGIAVILVISIVFQDRAAFGRAYIIGRALWGGSNTNFYGAMSTLHKLETDKKRPWALVSLH